MFVHSDGLGEIGATPAAKPAAKPAPAGPLPGGAASGVVFGGRPQWEAFVKAHGGLVTHIPRGDLKGELAASYGGRFVLAPLEIRKQERDTIAAEQADIARGAEADRMLRLVKDTAGTIGGAAKSATTGAINTAADIAAAAGKGAAHVVADTLNIPPWLIPVLLVGVGAVVLKTLLPTLPGIVTTRYGRR